MNILLMLIRAVHFGSCLILMSVFAMLLLVVFPALNQAGGRDEPVAGRYFAQLGRLLAICLPVAFVSGFLWLWFAIAGMNGTGLLESLQPGLFRLVLMQTPPGHMWMLRTGIAFLLTISLFLTAHSLRGLKGPSLPLFFSTTFAISLTASLAWLGHAGATNGPWQYLHLAADVLHLIAAGIWPSGLLPFAIFLGCLMKSGEPVLLSTACLSTRRFSLVSLVTVGILALSGTVNSFFLVGSLHALVSSDYGRLLLLKILLFLAATSIGAWNLLKLKPRLILIDGSESPGKEAAALAAIRRNVWIELWVGALIILVVGLLGMTAPAIQ